MEPEPPQDRVLPCHFIQTAAKVFKHFWGQMVETEWLPVWVWQSHVAEKLLEPYKTFSFF